MSFPRLPRLILVALAAAVLVAAPADARTLLKNVCRVKGQEENTLHGLGLVVGLKGTGDGGEMLPTMRSLSLALQLMGSPAPLGKDPALELKNAKNVALVMVEATVPAAGGRQGDKLNCRVSSIGAAKSLAGGVLLMTPLQGPIRGSNRVYAFAQGPLFLDDAKTPTTARIHQGCRLEEDFFNPYVKDGKMTLVLDKNHADFQVAQDTAELINSQVIFQSRDTPPARALNQANIEVSIPSQYRNDPVAFISQVLSLPILEPQVDARVVINERSGSIVINGDVEIGAVVVTHKNVVVETAGAGQGSRFMPIDTEKAATVRLQALVEQLNKVNVPNQDVIDIIKGLERNGKLHGTLIIE